MYRNQTIINGCLRQNAHEKILSHWKYENTPYSHEIITGKSMKNIKYHVNRRACTIWRTKTRQNTNKRDKGTFRQQQRQQRTPRHKKNLEQQAVEKNETCRSLAVTTASRTASLKSTTSFRCRLRRSCPCQVKHTPQTDVRSCVQQNEVGAIRLEHQSNKRRPFWTWFYIKWFSIWFWTWF